MLEVRGLESGYQRSAVLQGVDLDLPAGQVLGLLGRGLRFWIVVAGASTFLGWL